MQPVIEVMPHVLNVSPTPLDALEDLQAELYHEVRAHGRPVRQLLTALLDRRNLFAAWRFVRSNAGADTPGVDGITCKHLEDSANKAEAVSRLLNQISQEILDGRYQPQPPRWVEVPKRNGGARRLGILTVRDRIVHAALKQVLEPILEPTFLPSSFGFRPGRSVAGALLAALNWMKLGNDGQLIFPYAMHLDVDDCFDSIDHDHLLQSLSRHVADKAVLNLVGQLLQATGRTVRQWWFRTRRVGLLQGSPLSPLLCNLALHGLDQQMKTMRSATQQGIAYYRYADDILILARSEELARRAFYCARDVLAEIRLRFGCNKPPVVSLLKGVDWLGVRLRVRANRWTGQLEAGFLIPDDAVRDMIQRLTEMTSPPSAKLSEQTSDLRQWILSINSQLRGWYNSFQYADNIYDVARTLDDLVFRRFEEVLLAVTGKKRHEIRQEYLYKMPRGFRTWQADGEPILVLSAQPPRRLTTIAQPPRWMRPIAPHSAAASGNLPPAPPAILPIPSYSSSPPSSLPPSPTTPNSVSGPGTPPPPPPSTNSPPGHAQP